MKRALALAAVIGLVMAVNVGVAGADGHLSCMGEPATIVGTDGDDFLLGTPEDDVIVALDGNDTVIALTGNDVVCGGDGDDFVVGQQGEDVLSGGNGKDIVIGGPDNDRVYGDNGKDLLFGNFGNDILNGGNGADFLNGDLPFPYPQDPEAPPGAYQDPFENSDSCDGGNGPDAATYCEESANVESFPDPSTIIFG